jgi:hypothetical protein
VQENHDFSHRLLFDPGGENVGGANRPDTVNLAEGCRPECGWNLRGLISGDVKLSDCRFAFKQLPGREGEPLGSPLVSFSRGVRYLSTPFLSVSITRQDLSVDR